MARRFTWRRNLRLWRKRTSGRAGNGEPGRNRTCDPRIKSALLYQLSYGPHTFLIYHRKNGSNGQQLVAPAALPLPIFSSLLSGIQT